MVGEIRRRDRVGMCPQVRGCRDDHERNPLDHSHDGRFVGQHVRHDDADVV
uniref:Uncharacterized protein n=1 Tax=Romanomermis culicivorax TaxID=13658 RepID=A0A915ICK7_ROMCU